MLFFPFPWVFSYTAIDDSQDSMKREGTIFLFLSTTSTLSRTFRQLFANCIWDDYLIFLIALHISNRLNKIYPPLESNIWLNVDWSLPDFFSVRVFSLTHSRFTGHQGKAGDSLFLSNTSCLTVTNIQTFICNFHVRCLHAFLTVPFEWQIATPRSSHRRCFVKRCS